MKTSIEKKKVTKPKKALIPRKPGKLTKKRQEEVFNFMAELQEEGKLGKYTVKQLAEMLNINKETACNYRKRIYKEIVTFDKVKIERDAIAMYERMKRNVHNLLDKAEDEQSEDYNPKVQLILMERWEKHIASYTKFLEDWNFKEKIADKVDIQQTLEVEHTINIEERAKQIIVDING